jgi:hypothetical protein
VTSFCKVANLNFVCVGSKNRPIDVLFCFPEDLRKQSEQIFSWFFRETDQLRQICHRDQSFEPYISHCRTEDMCAFTLTFDINMLSEEWKIPDCFQNKKLFFGFGYVVKSNSLNFSELDFLKEIKGRLLEKSFSELISKLESKNSQKEKLTNTTSSSLYSSSFYDVDSLVMLGDNNQKRILKSQYKLLRTESLDANYVGKTNTSQQSSSGEPKVTMPVPEKEIDEGPSMWAPIVYSRTYKDDYRFITYPKDLKKDEIDYIRSHIGASFRSPEKLRTDKRWLFLKKESDLYCVGLSCMGSDISDGEEVRDENGRKVHLFIGYVSKKCSSQVLERNLAQFKQLYKYVQDKWNIRNKSDIFMSDYNVELLFSPDSEITNRASSDDRILNSNQSDIYVWFDSEENRDKLWREAWSSQIATSLCLGFPRQKDAWSGPFLNVTVSDDNIPDTHEHISKLQNTDQSTSKNTSQDSIEFEPPPAEDNSGSSLNFLYGGVQKMMQHILGSNHNENTF